MSIPCRGAVAFAMAALVATAAGLPRAARGAGAAVPDGSATLEPAPRIEMRDFAPYRSLGTATISGTLDFPLRVFGDRFFMGSVVHVMPDNAYSEYVADEYRDAWFRNTNRKIDRGVSQFDYTDESGAGGRFSLTKFVPGRYLVFAGLLDSAATDAKACTGTYPGLDENGNATMVPVTTYCYEGLRKELLFVEGAVDVAAGQAAVVRLHVVADAAL